MIVCRQLQCSTWYPAAQNNSGRTISHIYREVNVFHDRHNYSMIDPLPTRDTNTSGHVVVVLILKAVLNGPSPSLTVTVTRSPPLT